jgi:hypothetical protein
MFYSKFRSKQRLPCIVFGVVELIFKQHAEVHVEKHTRTLNIWRCKNIKKVIKFNQNIQEKKKHFHDLKKKLMNLRYGYSSKSRNF